MFRLLLPSDLFASSAARAHFSKRFFGPASWHGQSGQVGCAITLLVLAVLATLLLIAGAASNEWEAAAVGAGTAGLVVLGALIVIVQLARQLKRTREEAHLLQLNFERLLMKVEDWQSPGARSREAEKPAGVGEAAAVPAEPVVSLPGPQTRAAREEIPTATLAEGERVESLRDSTLLFAAPPAEVPEASISMKAAELVTALEQSQTASRQEEVRVPVSIEATLIRIFVVCGVVALLIGMLFFYRYFLAHRGPLGKILTGAATGIVMLATGVVLERGKKLRMPYYAWALMGGGWAVLYFTAFASHHIQAARLLDNPAHGTAALLTVGSLIFLHVLATQRAWLLAIACLPLYGALLLSVVEPFTWIAATILGVLVALLSRGMNAPWLTLAGLAGTYVTLLVKFPAIPSEATRITLLFSATWLSFEIAQWNFWKNDAASQQAGFASASALGAGNLVGCFIGFWKIADLAHLERWSVLGLVGAVYLARTMLERIRAERLALDEAKRWSWVLGAAFASLVGVVAVFLHPDLEVRGPGGMVLAAVMFWLFGVLCGEGIFLYAAFAVFSLGAGWFVLADLLRYLPEQAGAPGAELWRRCPTLAGAVAIAYLCHAWLLARGKDKARIDLWYGATGGFLAALGLWIYAPMASVAVGWAILAVVLFELGQRLGYRALREQAYLLLLAASVRLFFADFNLEDILAGPTSTLALPVRVRVATCLGVALSIVYVQSAIRTWKLAPEIASAISSTDRYSHAFFQWVWPGLLGSIVWMESSKLGLAAWWGGIGLGISVLGMLLLEPAHRWQGVLFFLGAFGQVLVAGIPRWSQGHLLAGSEILVALTIAGAFALMWVAERIAPFRGTVDRIVLRRLLAWLPSLAGNGAVLVLLAATVPKGYLTLAWAVASFLLLGLGIVLDDRALRVGSIGLLTVALGRLFLYDLTRLEIIYRIVSFIGVGALLLILGYFYARYRGQFSAMRRRAPPPTG